MDFTYPTESDGFRTEIRSWLADHLVGDFRPRFLSEPGVESFRSS